MDIFRSPDNAIFKESKDTKALRMAALTLRITLKRSGHVRIADMTLPMVVAEELQKDIREMNKQVTVIALDLPIPGIDTGDVILQARIRLEDQGVKPEFRSMLAALAARYHLRYRIR